MMPYWFVFILLALIALTHMRPQLAHGQNNTRWSMAWTGIFTLLVLFIGMRHEIGVDWGNYLDHFEDVSHQELVEALNNGDPAYQFLNWFGSHYWGGFYFVNTVSAFLFTYGLLTFCKVQPRPWLALLVAVPYLVIVVAMGYTRQGVAIGLAMLGLTALMEGRGLRFLLWIAFAVLFHKSAIILVPFAMFANSKHRWIMFVGVLLATGLLFALLLQESLEGFREVYIEAEYQSGGAAIRIAMNALPAVLFLFWRKHFIMRSEQRKFWTWMSLAALCFVALLLVSPSSTAVDRVALYWIPLQLVVWSHLPDVLGRPGQRNPLWVSAVMSYCTAVMFVWFFFANFSWAWLPYKFYPWVWLWT